jgi:hypothetical protein
MQQATLQDFLNQPANGQPQGGITDEEMLMRMFLQHQQAKPAPMDPNMLIKLCAMGLAGLVTIAATLTAWMYRPVEAMAQADALRTMSYAVTQQSAHVQEAIATANPPEFNCVTLLGTCKFPEQSARQAPAILTQAPVQQQPAQVVQQPLPESMGHAVAVSDNRAISTITEWENAGYDSGMIQQFILGLYSVPDPSYPAPDELAEAYREVYFH